MTDKTGREAEHVEKSPAGVVDPKDAAVPAEHPAPAGARGRIVRASPPAPVPEKRPTPAVQDTTVPPEKDKSALTGRNAENESSNQDVIRATGTMAIATLLSRITGFLRQMLIGATLGATVGTAFSSANQIPNLVTEIVLGAVLTSLVVPVLVRAEKEDTDRGETFVRRLFTLAFSILGIVTIASVVLAPFLTRMMLPEDSKANAVQATSLAFLLLPQILFYGLFALFQAVLNTKNIFGPGAWAPVVNNVISISVLLAYRFLPGQLDPHEPTPVADPHVMRLGLGTTTAVMVQCLILLPYLKKAGINLRPKWGLDARIKQFGGMALAIITYVAISQLGYVITSRVAAYADAGAPLVYQNAWLMLQVPYGVIGVTLLTAIMPRLSRNAADGDVDAVVRDLTLGSKLTFIALIPIVIFMTGFGVPIARALFQYGAYGAESAEQLGLTISFSAFTLIPYALVLLHLRVFYAREEAWTPTFIIAGITLTKIVLTLLAPLMTSNPDRVVILLGTANGFGFVSGAVIGGFLLKRKLGSLGGKAVTQTVLWASGAGLVGLVVSWVLYRGVNFLLPENLSSIVSLIKVAVLGVIFLIATGLVPRTIPSLPDLVGIRVLRTYDESLALRAHAGSAKRAVVIGAGFIGCEVAASLRKMGVEVTIVEPQPTPLASVLGTEIGELVARLHRAEGVDVRCGVGVTGVTGTGHVEKVQLADGTELDADVVVVGIGSRPSTDWLDGSGIAVDNGVVCDAAGRTSAPNVWAIGDVASWRDAAGHQVRVEHWSNVAEQARVIVPAMLGQDAAAAVVVPYFWSDQYDVKIQCLGEPKAGDTVHIIEDDGRKFLAFYERDGAVSGVVGGGMPGKVMKNRAKVAAAVPIADVLG